MNYNNDEFFEIIQPILEVPEFKKLDDIRHHGITRLDHCLRVAYYSYLISKLIHLNYKEVTEAALLHDFFTDEVDDESMPYRLRRHASIACNNASKYFRLSEMQKDIILTHMFPITFTPPKYLESWIVDFVDDIAAIYEKFYSVRKELNAATNFLFLFLVNYIKFIR